MPVLSGVPQGTVLGPILFLLSVNDLECCIKNSNSSSFADDTRISGKITIIGDTHQLQTDLNKVIKWSTENNMQLHEDKFELLSYRIPKNKMFTDDYLLWKTLQVTRTTPAGLSIEQTSPVRDLGVYMSSDYSWTPHINMMVDNARKIVIETGFTAQIEQASYWLNLNTVTI